MSKVFADTFYFLALLNKNDEAHEKALVRSAILDELVTTEWVLTELADGLASSRHRNVYLKIRQELLMVSNRLRFLSCNVAGKDHGGIDRRPPL